ncbi:unknown [Eubacterium sp. CAG:603]|nr:unknown [Eubacterium sp. CAG:603]
MDGDYDYDRYDKDSDYADGVDDAIDEFDED